MTTTTAQESRSATVLILAVSLAAIGFLFWLLYFREGAAPASTGLEFLPALNATFNGLAATSIGFGVWAIKSKRRGLHRALMLTALVLSSLFLAGYITHHALHGDTRFQGDGAIKGVYLSVLASHVVLSVVALPMVLMTFYLSLSGRLDRHRRLARFTYPIWLYVSVTGVVVFAMLKTLSSP